VIPDDIKRAFIAFLHRDRKFSDDHFYRTHSQARKILLDMDHYYPDIKVIIIESSYKKSKMGDQLSFSQIDFESHQAYRKYLFQIQLSENDIIQTVNK